MAENGNGYYSFIKEKPQPIVTPITPIQPTTPVSSNVMPTTGGPRITPQPTPIQPPTKIVDDKQFNPVINNFPNPTPTPVQPTQTVPTQQPTPQPVQQTTTPTNTPTPQVQQPQGIKDYLVNTLKIDPSLIGFQNGPSGQLGKVTINGMPLDIQGLSIQNGQSYADPNNINNAYTAMNTNSSANVNQNNDTLINNGIQGLTDAQNTFKDIIKNVQDHPFTDQYIAEKKAYLEQLGKTFDYNPETDLALKQASKIATRNVEEELNARGILNSSITGDRLNEIQTTLLPQYRQLAFDEYNKQLDITFKKLNVLQGLTEFDYTQYKDWVNQNMDIANVNLDMAAKNLDTMFKVVDQKNNKELKKIQTQQINVESALMRTKLNGYVSNTDSLILGVKPGTLSEEAQQRAYEFEKYAEQQKLQFEYDKKSKALDHQYTMSEISARAAETRATTEQKAAAKDTFPTATKSQIDFYNEYMRIFFATPDNEFYNNPDRVYQRLIGRADIANDVGKDIYNYMIKQTADAASKIATVKPTQDKDVYSSFIDKTYASKPETDGPVVYDTVGIKNYLMNLENSGIDSSLIDQLLLKYGLSLGE